MYLCVPEVHNYKGVLILSLEDGQLSKDSHKIDIKWINFYQFSRRNEGTCFSHKKVVSIEK